MSSQAERFQKVFLLPWLEDHVLRSKYSSEAQELFLKIAKDIPEVATLTLTPQGPKFHAEGGRVRVHVERITAVLLALQEQKSLAFLEEIAREKEFNLEFASLHQSLVTNKDFFLAYAFAHDLGKDACLIFDVHASKQWEKNDFRQHYEKLFQAFVAAHPGLSEPKLVAAFHDEQGIETHYKGHDRLGAGTEFTQAREAILEVFNVPLSHAKLFAELIRLHMDILTTFTRSPDALAYKAFIAIALKAGLNKDKFIDLAAGAIFLDAVVGSLHYEEGKFFHTVTPIVNFYRAEREAAPELHILREEAEKRAGKAAVKAILEAGGLAPEEIFALLKTPIGPVRGEIMKKIYVLVENPEGAADFGEHTAEIRRRALKTQALFRERGIAFTL